MKFKVGDVIQLTEEGIRGYHEHLSPNKFLKSVGTAKIEKIHKVDNAIYSIKFEGYNYWHRFTEDEIQKVDKEYVNVKLSHCSKYFSDDTSIKMLKQFAKAHNGKLEDIRLEKIKKYKPYSEPKLKWIGEKVKHKSNGMFERIRYISDSGVIFSGDGSSETPFDYLYKNYTWLDGSPCGIKQ